MDTLSFPTGIHDIDREILFNIPDEELFSTCISSKYLQEVCNENFWQNKFIRKFGVDLGKDADKPYRDLYREFNLLNTKELFKNSLKKGYLPIIKSLVDKNIINIHDDNERALRSAACFGHLVIIKYLVNSGADIHAFDDAALSNSAVCGHLNVVKYLIKHGANIHTKNDETFRHTALYGHLDIVKYLIKNGANIHANGDYALRLAAINGHLNVVKYLIEGPEDAKGDKRPWDEGCKPLVPWHPANIHANNDEALRYAAANGHLDVVKYLVEKGAYIHAIYDATLRVSAENGHLDIVKYLIENGANIHAGNDYALRFAVYNGHLDVVKCLIENGANLEIIRNIKDPKI
jgi:ankyrin repeat protein